MGYQAKFNKAFQFQEKGDYREATRLYRELIKKKPKLFDAQQMLGLCYHEQGELQSSIHHYQQALSINPKHTATLSNLGNAFLDAGQLDSAKQQLEKALKFDPGHAAAYNSLGNYYQKIRDFSSAIAAYNKAIAHSPSEASYHDNLGVVYYKQGKFGDALKTLQTAHNLNPAFTPVLIHMFDLLMMMQQSEDAVNLAVSCLRQRALDSTQQMEMHIGIAKVAWLFGDLDLAQHHLSLSTSVHQQYDEYPNTKNLRVFHDYLSKLLIYRENHPEVYQAPTEQTLVMFSESHGFAPSQTQVCYSANADRPNNNGNSQFQVLSFMVTGCKVWHLSQPNNNLYQESIKTLMSKLPQRCSIVLGFGEIDCRTNEGIYHHCEQTGKSFQEVIPSMVEEYVRKMLDHASAYQHKLIFYGVPAPLENRLIGLSEKQAFIDLIRTFNHVLEKSAASYQCDFLDVYNMTCNSEGIGDERFYIDNIHLKPASFSELFTHHLKSF